MQKELLFRIILLNNSGNFITKFVRFQALKTLFVDDFLQFIKCIFNK